MKRWLPRLLALTLGLAIAGALLWTQERRMRVEESAAIARVTNPACVQYGVREDGSDKGRGWHDAAEPPSKGEGTRRIVVVGDSVSFGLGVDSTDVWSRQLEGWLRAQAGRHAIELFNFGTNGYDARRIACLVTHRLEAWAPDVVVWGAYNNDVAPTFLLHSQDLEAPVFTAPEVPEGLRLLPAPLSALAIRHSAAWRRYQGARLARRLEVDPDAASALSPESLVPAAAAELTAWAEQTGVPVIALALPPHVLAAPDRCSPPPGATWGCALLEQRHEALLTDLSASGLPSHDLLPALQASGAPAYYLPSDPLDADHPNRAGHTAMARGALPILQEHLGLPLVAPEDLTLAPRRPRRGAKGKGAQGGPEARKEPANTEPLRSQPDAGG